MKNLIQAAVVTLFAASTAQAQQAVQWKVSDGGNGHWYRFDQAILHWQPHRDRAVAQGGHLATVTSPVERSFVESMIYVQECDIWLGGQTNWPQPITWVTGEPFTFTPSFWCSNNGYNPGGGYAIEICGRSNCMGQYCWNIESETSLGWPGNRAVYEWEADCNADGIVDYGQCHDGSLPDYNGNNIPDCCERGEACVVGNYPVQWKASEGGNGHWYEVRASGPALNWSQARDSAAGLGGRLASFETLAEFSRVATTIATRPQFWTQRSNYWRGPWIGGFQDPSDPMFSEPAGGWRWESGVPIDLDLLAVMGQGNPNNFPCCEDRMQFGEGQFTPTVNDVRADDPAISFVVEYSGDCNADGIVDYGQILQGQLADLESDGVPDICQQPTCVAADIYRDFNVNGADLGILLSQWGPNTPLTESDLNSDGVVNGADLGILLSFWGPCQS
jgi:hypothetical protein